MRRVSRSQVTHVPISNCSCSMCAMTVSKLMSTCGNNSCASGGDGRCASNGAFSTGVPVDWGLSQRPARVDCGLSHTTGQATIALRAIVFLIAPLHCFYLLRFGFLLGTTAVLTTSTAHICTYTAVRYCSICRSPSWHLYWMRTKTKRSKFPPLMMPS